MIDLLDVKKTKLLEPASQWEELQLLKSSGLPCQSLTPNFVVQSLKYRHITTAGYQSDKVYRTELMGVVMKVDSIHFTIAWLHRQGTIGMYKFPARSDYSGGRYCVAGGENCDYASGSFTTGFDCRFNCFKSDSS